MKPSDWFKASHIRIVLHSALKLTEPQNLLMKTYFRSCLLCQSTYMRMLQSINMYLSEFFHKSKVLLLNQKLHK